MGKLAAAAQFWAIRLWEFSRSPKIGTAADRTTLCLKNTALIMNGNMLQCTCAESHYLADCVSITLERKKKNGTSDTLTQCRMMDPYHHHHVSNQTTLVFNREPNPNTKGKNKNSPISLAPLQEPISQYHIIIAGKRRTSVFFAQKLERALLAGLGVACI
jgi:hypothetical protein